MSVIGTGAVFVLSGCTKDRLAELEKNPMFSASHEGTGFQFVGIVKMIAIYHASGHQKAVAEEQARKVFLYAAKPDYERRRAETQAQARKKIADLEAGYAKRIAEAQHGKPATAPVADLEAEKKRVVEKAAADAAAELASLERGWHSLAGTSARGLKMQENPSAPGGGVPLASTRDREALVASAAAHLPKYIAVAVPPQGIAAEQGGKSIIMLWDTRRQRLADDEVRVLNRTLRDGVDVNVGSLSARFASAP